MRILIIEDEELIGRRLQRMLTEVDPTVEVVDILRSVKAIVQYFGHTDVPHIDLIMSDIRLGDGLVFEALGALDIKTHIVFVTAYDEYAITAFKYNGIDYILKPPSADDLKAALRRAGSLGAASTPSATLSGLVKQPEVTYRRRFLVETGTDTHRVVDVDNVAYLTTRNGVVWLRTFDDDEAVAGDSLERLSAELDPAVFFRANRQYLVNIAAIDGTTMLWNRKIRVTLKPGLPTGADIVVSREKITGFRNWLKGR